VTERQGAFQFGELDSEKLVNHRSGRKSDHRENAVRISKQSQMNNEQNHKIRELALEGEGGHRRFMSPRSPSLVGEPRPAIVQFSNPHETVEFMP